MTAVLTLLELGRVEYGRALRLQEKLVELRRAGAIGDVLLLLEHPPVLTLGRNGGRNGGRAFVVASDEELAKRGVAVHVVKRGGDVTYHGPGQLVGYPIMDLRAPDLRAHLLATGARMGVVDFVRRLEEVLIRVAGEYGVRSQRVAGRTGVWTEAGGAVAEKKLAAIGVHVSRGITSHGFALNVSTDLREFGLIVPCGIADRGVTSLEDEVSTSEVTDEVSTDAVTDKVTGEFRADALTVAQVARAAARVFGRLFDMQVLAVAAPEDVHPELAGW